MTEKGPEVTLGEVEGAEEKASNAKAIQEMAIKNVGTYIKLASTHKHRIQLREQDTESRIGPPSSEELQAELNHDLEVINEQVQIAIDRGVETLNQRDEATRLSSQLNPLES